VRALLFGLAALGAGCTSGAVAPSPYQHNRVDYEAFRRGHPELLEPNYLPFMATRVRLESAPARAARALARLLGFDLAPAPEVLLFCRWNESDFPLAVQIEAPEIPAELSLDVAGRQPADYVAAAERALRLWEQGLEGLVRFEIARDAASAELRLRLTADPGAPAEAEVQVLGTTPLGSACRVDGGDAASGRLDARFAVRAMLVRVADEFGLLLPDQVERIALHEIGHALGMRTHSPIPADLMYPVVRDRLPRGELGTEDVNSFVSLYSLPNGAVYRVLGAEPEPSFEAPLPAGPPAVELAPHVDPRLGYEIQLPRGWTRLDTGFGVVAVDGTTWDYEASLQVIVRGFASVDDYLERYRDWHFGSGRITDARSAEVAGRPARRFRSETGDGRSEELVLVESGDGRVVVVLWDCPSPQLAVFQPWFEASLATLELRAAGGDRGRDYLGGVDGP
jgi:predicted Zn-dependent protease